jgi:TRAP-type C4-dicarboxylate transport system permease small subunit
VLDLNPMPACFGVVEAMASESMNSKADTSATRRALLCTGDRFSNLALGLAAAALFLVVAFNAINVILRYFFSFSVSWAQEAMLYLTIFGVYMGAIAVAWQQGHIRIDAILSLAPPAWHGVLNAVSTLVLTVVLIPVVFASFQVVALLFEVDERSDALQIPMWIPQSIVPISLLLIVIMAIARLIAPKNPRE